MTCQICARPQRGFGYIRPPLRAGDPKNSKQVKHFCSRNCQTIFTKNLRKNMLNFNHRPNLSEKINILIDEALQKQNDNQIPRDYLGASRLGISCNRALQFGSPALKGGLI